MVSISCVVRLDDRTFTPPLIIGLPKSGTGPVEGMAAGSPQARNAMKLWNFQNSAVRIRKRTEQTEDMEQGDSEFTMIPC